MTADVSGIFLSGRSESAGIGSLDGWKAYQWDGWLLHLDLSGKKVWSRVVGSNKFDELSGITWQAPGKLVVNGTQHRGDATSYETWQLGYDTKGKLVCQ